MEFNHAVFDRAVREVFARGGFSPEMLADPAVRPVIVETYNALNRAVDSAIKTETPPELTAALQNNAFIFSGFKTYHSLSEVGLALTDADGKVKPFDTFRKDVEVIDKKYNTNYLFAEYNHAVHTSQMAVKWHDFVRDGDRYNLQYRTAGDERVRSEHAALNNITLPPSDPFWNDYLPPNGWNCRCDVDQVLREDYPLSDPEVAKAAGDACTEEPKSRIFRYNAGREMTLFPKKHPYLPKGCDGCPRNGGNGLSLGRVPGSERCRACDAVQEVCNAHEEASLSDKLRALLTEKGRELTRILREIVASRRFKEVEGHSGVRSAIDQSDPDYAPLVACADKAVTHGYNVVMLPNPKGFRTPDFILYNGKFIAAYDVKTISGQNSVGNRLNESIGQTNRVILNMATTYNARALAKDLRSYFEANKDAVEVLIFKGGAQLSVTRKLCSQRNFIGNFVKQYGKKK